MNTVSWHLDPTEPIIREHVIHGRTVLPFASFLKHCLEAVTALQTEAPRELVAMFIRKPIVFAPETSITVHFIAEPAGSAGRFEVREPGLERPSNGLPLAEGGWKNASDGGGVTPRPCSGPTWNHEAFYEAAGRAGFSYGPLLRRVRQMQASDEAWSGDLLPIPGEYAQSVGRTAAWDALLQGGTVMAASGAEGCWVPFRIDRACFGNDESSAPIARFYGEWIADSSSHDGERVANLWGFGNGSGRPRIELLGVHYRVVDRIPGPSDAAREVVPSTFESAGPEEILQRLRSSPAELRRPLLIRFIEDQLLEVLRWDDSRRADLTAGFVAIGVDSLMSVDLQYRLQTALDFALPLGEGFDSLSVEDLADALLERHLPLD